MFEYQPSRHPLQTFQFWFAVLFCAGGVALWRFGGFGKSGEPEATAEYAAEYAEEQLPLPPMVGEVNLGEDFDLGNLTPAPLQFEEEASSLPQQVIRSNEPIKDVTAQPFPSLNSTQTKLPAADQNIQQLSSESTTVAEPLKTANLDFLDQQQNTNLPDAKTSQLDLAEVDQLIAAGDDVIALRTLSKVYWQSPEHRPSIRSRLNSLTRRIYFQPQPHYMEPYEVQFGDRLELIAKKYQVPWQYLAKMNRIDAQRLRTGKKLKVIQGPFSVVIDLSKFEATVHAHGYFVVRMPVGIGKDGASPVGTFRVTDKVEDPIYYGPDGVIKNDDPLNPLGERWIAISDEANTLQGYGLHGTIDPDSIGKSESRGCVRFHDQDIADLYDLLTVGSEVIIRR